MILSRVNSHLKQHHRCSLSDMAASLNAAPEALRDMLALLERKGRVRKLPGGTACGGGCSKCAPDTIELYEWTAPA